MSAAHALFPVVGIGASAGGVEALEGFFRAMPPACGCGFVIVTHLSPDRPSVLPQIIARYTDMPVHVAADGADVAPDAIHVMPPDSILEIENGKLRLQKTEKGRRDRKPIDIFLGSLALDRGEYAAGVILSGGDGDGTLGVKAIKERGGLTLAQLQDGEPPRHSGMPQSAIASGMIDLAVPLSEMGRHLKEFAQSLHAFDAAPDKDERGLLRSFEQVRHDLYAILRNQLGHDFSGYKERTFFRRVQRRMQVNCLETPGAYVERLRQDPREVVALFRDLLINVTNFFRDSDAFEVLGKTVIPKLFANRGADDTVRVWVPGCATGEEVFSIAILLREHMDTLTAVPRVQIFATDIDEPALVVARAARYPAALLDSVSPARRARFFTADGGSYLLTKDVRELCIFSSHSLIRDPPFSRLDLVSCRNLLIYFGPDIQGQVIPTFHFALRPGGYLFLGSSENVSQFGELFAAIDKKNRLFQRRENGALHPRLPLPINGIKPAPFLSSDRASPKPPAGAGFRQSVEAQVLANFTPAHVVVNGDGDVIFYSARTGKYLEATPGTPSRQLLTMARKGLRLELRATLREALETKARVVRAGLAVENDEGRVQKVDLAVEPVGEKIGEEALFLVVFTDVGPVLSREELSHPALRASDEAALQLERELRDTRERLQSLIEEYETALEELKSSNEELVSVNEELQSTNEELEASKEELQSLNEELHTVNAELVDKVDGLDRANSDLSNLFESTRVATVFLDDKLVIRNYTPAVSHIFNILPTDRGRPLTDLSARIKLDTLGEDVRQVLASGETLERSIDHDDGAAHYLVRVAPYRDSALKVEGVVLTFIDVTSLTNAEIHQRVLIAELNHRVKNMLAIVIGIAELTYRSTADAASFKARFVARVQSMARSYELLSRERWTDALIGELVRPQLAPFGLERLDLEGPDVRLGPKQALSLGMILHELATNAAKYGALRTERGRVGLQWSKEPAGDGTDIVLRWRESGGPPIDGAPTRGFGLTLVEQETSYTLNGSAHLDFASGGLVVTLRFRTPDQRHASP
jgi:two-component system CheB/CheR fusion protein